VAILRGQTFNNMVDGEGLIRKVWAILRGQTLNNMVAVEGLIRKV